MQTSRIVIFGLFLFFTGFGQSTITDANWVSMPGTNSSVSALACDNSGDLYAGGFFTMAGGVKVNHIARWDGSAWSALGSGTNGAVNALAVDISGKVYVGGSFDTAGGVRAKNIACWDGSGWSALGSGTNNIINAIAVGRSGNVYAGGSFDTAGSHLAQWDGSGWNALDSGIQGSVIALEFDTSGKLFVCAGGAVLKWNGILWSLLGDVNINSGIHAFMIDKANSLYIGGTLYSDVAYNCVARWSGAAWSLLGSGAWTWNLTPPEVTALAADSSGHLYAGGHFFSASGVNAWNLAGWDGSMWSGSGLGVSESGFWPNIYALVVDNSQNLYVGGLFDNAGGKPAANIARCFLNGTSIRAPHYGINKQSILPAIKAGSIHFTLFHPSSVNYKVLDISGRELTNRKILMLGAGNHAFKIATGDLCPGVYILDFHVGGQSFKGRFSITK